MSRIKTESLAPRLAWYGGHEKVVELLLSEGVANVNTQDDAVVQRRRNATRKSSSYH